MDENNVYHTSSLYNFINEKNGDRLALNWNQNLELEFWKIMFLRKYTRTGAYQKLTVSPGFWTGLPEIGSDFQNWNWHQNYFFFKNWTLGSIFCVELELELEPLQFWRELELEVLHKSQEPLNTGKDLTSVMQLSSSCNPNWKLC